MDKNAQGYISELIKLEPVFKKAGELAVKMQKTAASRNKFNTGITGIDIVTEADLAVQEAILFKMAKTKLVDCQLFAEEDTLLTKKFHGTNGLVLALDPIDGTIFYAKNGRFYCTILTLHDKKNILYTFYNYPEINWSIRVANGKIKTEGVFPEVLMNSKEDFSKVIFHTGKNPKKIGGPLYQKLESQGYKFYNVFEHTREAGSCTMLFSGKSGGYFTDIPNPYDGLGALYYGQTKKYKIFNNLDLSKTFLNDHGPHYSGWYVIINK